MALRMGPWVGFSQPLGCPAKTSGQELTTARVRIKSYKYGDDDGIKVFIDW
jgi:hypothetical protein